MIFRGTVMSVTGTATGADVQFEIHMPGSDTPMPQFEAFPGVEAAGRLKPGDRIVWWPMWQVERDPAPGFAIGTRGRFVREADLSEAELAELELQVAIEARNAERARAVRSNPIPSAEHPERSDSS